MWMRLSRLGCRDSTRREHGRHLFTRKLASGQGCRLGRGLFSKGRRSRGRRLPHSQIRAPGWSGRPMGPRSAQRVKVERRAPLAATSQAWHTCSGHSSMPGHTVVPSTRVLWLHSQSGLASVPRSVLNSLPSGGGGAR